MTFDSGVEVYNGSKPGRGYGMEDEKTLEKGRLSAVMAGLDPEIKGIRVSFGLDDDGKG